MISSCYLLQRGYGLSWPKMEDGNSLNFIYVQMKIMMMLMLLMMMRPRVRPHHDDIFSASHLELYPGCPSLTVDLTLLCPDGQLLIYYGRRSARGHPGSSRRSQRPRSSCAQCCFSNYWSSIVTKQHPKHAEACPGNILWKLGLSTSTWS